MPLKNPLALLSLWNDIERERIPEYDRWHTLEHVAERVWVPGYIAATRYVATTEAQVRYFTLYELDGLDCLRSEAYNDLVANPTPWSASMRPSFSNFLRKTGPVCAQAGNTAGCAVSIVRWVWPQTSAPSAAALQRYADQLLFTGAALGVTRVRIQAVETAGPQALRNVDSAPTGAEYVGIVDSFEPDVSDALARLATSTETAAWPVAPVWRAVGSYRMASRVHHADVAAPTRPAPRLDLMPR
ncbi:hypothetical protein [Hydrogenophaga sp. BPS33]|uniref:hypothetical protein n=1 Tax=Hydrogenophaga sp. BPS33 TaxID=2651974 RepID=UPI00131F579D|nr:hypothetical protein [Hydrogenophaga sp. BPS33]QHE85553.1 hypothetical protein F9K07_11905 [Hydrogenophaga sp. BPS33]